MLKALTRPPFATAVLIPVVALAAALAAGAEPLAALAVGLAGGLSLSGSI